MTNELQERIQVKMFIGCLLTSDLQYLLNQSHAWKEWLLTQGSTTSLQEVHYKGKTYLGTFCTDDNVTIAHVESLHEFIQSKFSECCPTLNVDTINIHIFPQVFIS